MSLLLLLTDDTTNAPAAVSSGDLEFNPRCYPFKVTTDDLVMSAGQTGASGYSFDEYRYSLPMRLITIAFTPTDYANAFNVLRFFEESFGTLPMIFDHPDDSDTLNVIFDGIPTLRLVEGSFGLFSVTVKLREVPN